MKIKRIVTFIMILCCILSCTSCAASKSPDKHILKAWTGDFSQDKWKEAIITYKAEYTPFSLGDTWQITFTIDEDISGYRLPIIAYCDDEFGEMTSYIDSSGYSSYNEETHELTINNSWLSDTDSWVHKHNTWAYLIKAATTSGETVYYYLRVTFDN